MTQNNSEIILPQETETKDEYSATILSVNVPDKGYLCKITPPSQEGAPYIVTPIESLNTYNSKIDPHVLARRLLEDEVTPADAVPVFREQTQVNMIIAGNETSQDVTTNVFDVLVKNPNQLEKLENDEGYVFVPENALKNNPDRRDVQSITKGDQTLEVFIHPDCEQLVQAKHQKIEVTGKESETTRRKVAKGIITAVEKVDEAYNYNGQTDRLCLKDIEALRGILPDTKLADDLEAAYIREKMLTLGFQQAAALALNAGIVETVLHDQDSLTLMAIGGALVNDAFGKAMEGNTKPKSFRELMNDAITEIS